MVKYSIHRVLNTHKCCGYRKHIERDRDRKNSCLNNRSKYENQHRKVGAS